MNAPPTHAVKNSFVSIKMAVILVKNLTAEKASNLKEENALISMNVRVIHVH